MTWKRKWIEHNACKFCRGNDLHTCLLYRCQDAIRDAERYFDSVIRQEETIQNERNDYK